MYKKIFAVLLLCVLALPLFSQETGIPSESPNPGRFSLDVGFGFSPRWDINSNIGFGFLIFHNNTWDIRNHTMLNVFYSMNGGLDDGLKDSTFNLVDKVSFGWVHESGFFRPYSYLEGSIGFFDNDTKDLWSMPLAFSAGLGVGVEIFPWVNQSFFFESGIVFQFMGDDIFFVQNFALGLRHYLK
jgi:hypothetical protein